VRDLDFGQGLETHLVAQRLNADGGATSNANWVAENLDKNVGAATRNQVHIVET